MPAVGTGAFVRPLAPKIIQAALPEAGEGAYACLRELSARDLMALRERYGKEGDTANLDFLFDVLARSICDDTGAMLFADGTALRDGYGLSLTVLERLAGEAMRASGLEVREKNSPPASSTS